MSKLHKIVCTCYLRPWLHPSLTLTTMQYVMYLGFVCVVMFAHNGPYCTWLIGRMLKVTQQSVMSTIAMTTCIYYSCSRQHCYNCPTFVEISVKRSTQLMFRVLIKVGVHISDESLLLVLTIS